MCVFQEIKKFFVVMCGLLLITGCSTSTLREAKKVPPVVMSPVDAEQQVLLNNEELSNDDVLPHITPGVLLNISVTVAGETEIYKKDNRVSQQGYIYLPLLKDVQIVGLTIPEAEKKLEKLCEQYFKEPQVEISFSRVGQDDFVSPWGYVTVMGNVVTPGRIALPQGRKLHVSEAVALAGGLAPSAKARAIRLTRKTSSGKLIKKKINLHAIVAGGRVDKDIELLPGDIIFVPESIF